MAAQNLKQVVALAKRRGFAYPGSGIYGGLANTYDYGPAGAELLKNLKDLWWQHFVRNREDIYGLDISTILNPKVWQASGHTTSFSDVLIECKNCHKRTRADHLIEANLPEIKVEGRELKELAKLINSHQLKCPSCGRFDWTKPQQFNLLFQTKIGIVPESESTAYLRGELAQGIFVAYKNVLSSNSPKLPFGLAQIGRAFRNEITQGQFTFRTLEFELAELEYFIRQEDWQTQFDYWQKEVARFAELIGLDKKKLSWREHTQEELSHYSDKTADLEYRFPFGNKELFAVAYRTNYDLKNHMEKSGADLRYIDPHTRDKFIPHVIEPTFGLTRCLTALLIDVYQEDKGRVFLQLKPALAPYKVAVFPLVNNQTEIVDLARKTYHSLKNHYTAKWDDRGNIGKRYYAQDEIGTPLCVTVDHQSLKDDAVTVRHRDNMEQERVSLSQLETFLQNYLI